MNARWVLLTLCLLTGPGVETGYAYPIDGYAATGIRRLVRAQLIASGALSGPKLATGAMHPLDAIHLNLVDDADSLSGLPDADPELQQRLMALFPDRHESYSVAVMDLSPGRPIRYAAHQVDRLFSPGSVGKLAIAAGLFTELQRLYPGDPAQRQALLRSHMVRAGRWGAGDEHAVPVFNVDDREFASRPVVADDVFSLYEWADHMLSASANSAASVVWREVMLMRAFGRAYPPSPEDEEAFWKKTSKTALQQLALSVVNDPLRQLGIDKEDWQLGTFFTAYGQQVVPGAPSYANPRALMTYLMRLEQGRIVDAWSSLEIKRLLYMTARRIRYASSPALAKAAVYFKSGSLYRCQPEPGFKCGKYMGNVENVMNSVAIVERPDGRVYLVALMSNVLRKNSAVDHQTLATQIDRILGE